MTKLFEEWALERARRYLGVSGDGGSQPEFPADRTDAHHQTRRLAPPETEALIDKASEAGVRDFPSSDASALLIVVIKELVASDAADSFEAPDSSQALPVAAEAAEPAWIQPEGAAESNEPAVQGSEAEVGASEVAPVSGPKDEEDQKDGGSEGLFDSEAVRRGTQIPGKHADNALDETAVSEMREPSRTLPAHKEISRLIARPLPFSEVEADDCISAVYFVKRVRAAESDDFDEQYHCGVLSMTSVSKLSQVISKAYLPAIHQASNESARALGGQEVASTLTKLSASLSSAVTSMKGNVSMEIPDIDFERGPALLKMDPYSMSVLKSSLQAWISTVRDMVEETSCLTHCRYRAQRTGSWSARNRSRA